MCKDANNTTAPVCEQCGKATKFYASSGLAKPFCAGGQCGQEYHRAATKSKLVEKVASLTNNTQAPQCACCGNETAFFLSSRRARKFCSAKCSGRFHHRLKTGTLGKDTHRPDISRARLVSIGMLRAKTRWRKCNTCPVYLWSINPNQVSCAACSCEMRQHKYKCCVCGDLSLSSHWKNPICSPECRAIRRKENKRKNQRRRRIRLLGMNPEKDGRYNDIEILKRDRFVCYICEGLCLPRSTVMYLPMEPTIDHITPLSRGGSDSPDNVACACRRCNSRKGSFTLLEFAQRNA